jgi:hypothetical protein
MKKSHCPNEVSGFFGLRGEKPLQKSKFSLDLSLNPSNGIFKINLSQPSTEIPIFDAMGKPVHQQQVDTQETFIDLT